LDEEKEAQDFCLQTVSKTMRKAMGQFFPSWDDLWFIRL